MQIDSISTSFIGLAGLKLLKCKLRFAQKRKSPQQSFGEALRGL
ncbi:hypothetical protein HDF15_004193 [Granulicella mallensis]|jgi:hypothetical protein|uniref:Uncharacterized protein n=1 Tax=Granulicella mallensis TaxID=940614 RepID=A0A7W8EAN9_9BACT|nr:hypothetical protein [Granulicella mallensis]